MPLHDKSGKKSRYSGRGSPLKVARFYYLLGAIFLFSLGTNVPKPIYPHYVLTFTTSYFTVGAVLSGLGYSRVFIEAPLGMVVERYGRRRIAILGSFSLVASALIGGLAPDLAYLVSRALANDLAPRDNECPNITEELTYSVKDQGHTGSDPGSNEVL